MQLNLCLLVIAFNCFNLEKALPLPYTDYLNDDYNNEEIDDIDKYIIIDPDNTHSKKYSDLVLIPNRKHASFNRQEEINIEVNIRKSRSTDVDEDGSGEDTAVPPVWKDLPPSQNESTDLLEGTNNQTELSTPQATSDQNTMESTGSPDIDINKPETVPPLEKGLSPPQNETTDELEGKNNQTELTTPHATSDQDTMESTRSLDFDINKPEKVPPLQKGLPPSQNETTDALEGTNNQTELSTPQATSDQDMLIEDELATDSGGLITTMANEEIKFYNITKRVNDVTTTTNRPFFKLSTIYNIDKHNNTYLHGQSTTESSISWIPVCIAVLISALIFFLLGVAFSKRCLQNRSESGVITGSKTDSPKQVKNGRESFRNLQHVDIQVINESSIKRDKPNKDSVPHIELETITEKTPLNNTENSRESVHQMEMDKLLDKRTPMATTEPTRFSTFKGKSCQSPINIETTLAVFNNTYSEDKLRLKPQNSDTYKITNTGTTLKVYFIEDKSTLEGGPLGKKTYQLDHIHFHWGSFDKGSEHTINGEQFLAEIHFVHWDKDSFTSFTDAAKSTNKDALAVIAVLIKIGVEHNKLSLITDNLSFMQYKGDAIELVKDFSPHSLLPENCNDYWSYSGSLTTAPFSENVTWIVFKDTIEISPGQIEELRQLRSHERDEGHGDENKENVYISNNFRKVQPIERRVIQASFK